MKTGLFGQNLTLMEELKASTWSCHARLQDQPFFRELAACRLPLESYAGQLRALAIIHAALEKRLDTAIHPHIGAVWNRDMRKLDLLRKDLRFFEPRALFDIRESVESSLAIADYILLRSEDQPIALLGFLYVFEGSTMGSRMLLPLYARAFLLRNGDGLAALRNYGEDQPSHWLRYSQSMNNLALTAEDRQLIVEAACDMFERITALFQTLYPYQPSSLTFTATSINPEAGRHPIPQNPREKDAALAAAAECWERHPYFQFRYGDRGLNFAKSDCAWLATLWQYDEAQILDQVRWLGGVLATRGMPTILLQEQLEILYDRLSSAIPEKIPAYEKLLAAARELHHARQLRFSDEQLLACADRFDSNAPPEQDSPLAGVGLLLAAAVADEYNGIEGAVAGIRNWAADPARFSESWAHAVRDAVEHALREGAKTGSQG